MNQSAPVKAGKRSPSHLSDKNSMRLIERITLLIPGIVAVYNIHTSNYIYINDALINILGYAKEEFFTGGVPFVSSLIHPDDISGLLKANNKAIKKANSKQYAKQNDSIISFEYRIKHKNGSWRWLKTDGIVFDRDEKGKIQHVMNISADITERKKADERQAFLTIISDKLAISLNHNLTLQEISSIIVPFLADYCRIAIVNEVNEIKEIVANHKDKSKVILTKELYKSYINDPTTTYGVKHILVKGKPEIITNVNDEVYKQVKENPEVIKIAKKIGLQSYMGVPLIARGKVIGAITFSSIQPHRLYTKDDLQFAQEIARRIALALDNMQLYKKIIENERLYRLVVENTNDLISLVDPKGTLLYISPSWTTVLGYMSDDLVGKNAIKTLVHPDDTTTTYKSLEKVLKRGIAVLPSLRLKGKNGNWITVEVMASAIYDEENQPYMLVVTAHDITQRTELERRKDDFISMASHELKTPVTSLMMFLQLLQKHNQKENDTHDLILLEKMDKQMKKMVKLISDLLDLSKIQVGKLAFSKESFFIQDLIKETIDALQPTTERHTLFVKGTIQEKVFADRDRIGQVLINLITNAIKYSPQADKIILSAKVKNDNIIITIQDFGIGITRQDQGKIFERFFRSEGINEKTYPGFGIGLYISHEIITKHNGRIWVESMKGKGSVFSFALPIARS